MDIKKFIKVSALCGAIALSFVTQADVTLTNEDGTKILFSKQMIYSQDLKQLDNSTLMSIDKGLLSTFKHKDKEYFQITIDEICSTQKHFSSLIPKFKHEPSQVVIKTAEKNVNIAGYSTTKYKIFEDDNLKQIVWLTSDSKLLSELTEHFSFMNKLDCTGGFTDSGYENSDAYKKLMAKGIPLKLYSDEHGDINEAEFEEYYQQRRIEENNELDSMELIKVKKVDFSDIPSSVFEIPADYKKITMQEYLMRTNPEMDEFVNPSAEQKANQQEALEKLEELVGKGSELGDFLSDTLGDF